MEDEKIMHDARNSSIYTDNVEVEGVSISSESEDLPICWICLESYGDLITPCKCPRLVHNRCLARWQLQSAGTRREKFCEFCGSDLPDWKSELTPKCGAQAPAVMNVNFDGRTYSFEVKPGPEGYRMFTESIRRAFNLPDDSELNITFTCDEPAAPDNGSLLTLQGPGAYDAAVHCASVSAARRMSGLTPCGTPTRSLTGGPSDMTIDHELGTPRAGMFGGSSSFSTPSREELPPRSMDALSPASKSRFSGIGRRLRMAFGDALGVAGRQ